jgi:hypothetical protein
VQNRTNGVPVRRLCALSRGLESVGDFPLFRHRSRSTHLAVVSSQVRVFRIPAQSSAGYYIIGSCPYIPQVQDFAGADAPVFFACAAPSVANSSIKSCFAYIDFHLTLELKPLSGL